MIHLPSSEGFGKKRPDWLITILLLVLSSPLFSQSVTVIRLDTCYARAVNNYPLIRQYGLIEKTKEYTLTNANRNYLPQLSITGIGAYIISGLPSISMPNSPPPEEHDFQFIGIGQLNQTIWDGGATRVQKEVAGAQADLDRASIEVSLFQLRERINQLYFGILVIDEQLKQLDILLENLNRSLNRVRLTTDNGLTYQPDVDQVQAEILSVNQRKTEFRYTRQGFVDMLALMTGMPLADTVQLAIPAILPSFSALPNNRPELRLYDSQTKLADAGVSFDRVTLMPKFGALAAGILIEPGMSFGTETMNSLAIAGISLSWSTAGFNTYWTNKKLHQVKLEKIANQKETFLFNNSVELKKESREVEKYREIIQTDMEIVSLKNRIREAYQLKYDNGFCSMNDLITSMNKESEARCNQALHHIQLLLSMYAYQTQTGH